MTEPTGGMTKGQKALLYGAAGLAVVTGISAIVAFSKIGTLNEGLLKETNVRKAAVDTIQSTQQAHADSNQVNFTRVDSTLGTLDLRTGKLELTTTGAQGAIAGLETKARTADSSIAATNDNVVRLEQMINSLGVTDTQLKSEIIRLCDGLGSLEQAQAITNAYLDFKNRVEAWNSDRGGFLGVGKRKEIPNMSPEEFRAKYGSLSSDYVPDGAKALVVFNEWLIKHGEKPRK